MIKYLKHFLSPVNLSDPTVQTPTPTVQGSQPSSALPGQRDPMAEFYQLKQELLASTLILTAVIFGSVWFFYSLTIALNYLLGACTGVVYLRMLARNVEQLGRQKSKLGGSQLAIFVGLMIVATQWSQLQVVPIFLGFLTYKAALIFYMLRTTLIPNQ